jgi:hypothetical protein
MKSEREAGRESGLRARLTSHGHVALWTVVGSIATVVGVVFAIWTAGGSGESNAAGPATATPTASSPSLRGPTPRPTGSTGPLPPSRSPSAPSPTTARLSAAPTTPPHTAAPLTLPAADRVAITWGSAVNCVDVSNDNENASAVVESNVCNHSYAQLWRFESDGHIHLWHKDTLCLAATSATPQAKVVLAPCGGSGPARWSLDSDGAIRLDGGDLCLTVPYDMVDHWDLWVDTCTGATGQRWSTYDPGPAS